MQHLGGTLLEEQVVETLHDNPHHCTLQACELCVVALLVQPVDHSSMHVLCHTCVCAGRSLRQTTHVALQRTVVLERLEAKRTL